MTMLSFRVETAEAVAAQRWAEHLGVDRSELLRNALHRYLIGLAAQHEPDVYEREPMTPDETAVETIADWGPAEDWGDWADAAG